MAFIKIVSIQLIARLLIYE